MRERRRVSTSTKNAIANTRILAARDMSEIYLAAILRRGYPRRIVRAIDGSSIGGSRGISGWVHRRAMQHSTRANARARPTYKTDYWTREGYGRASDAIKAITVIIIGGLRSSEPYQSLRKIDTRPISIEIVNFDRRGATLCVANVKEIFI